MTIMSNVEIARMLDSGELVIRPPPDGGPEDHNCYDTCSVHLHLGDEIWMPRPGIPGVFDLSQSRSVEEILRDFFEKRPIPDDGYAIRPGEYLLATTREYVSFKGVNGDGPLAGRIEGRSRFARAGLLVHCTAPTIHAEWDGNISLELKNLGVWPIILKKGLPLCQLIVEEVYGKLRYGSAGAFDGQTSPTGRR